MWSWINGVPTFSGTLNVTGMIMSTGQNTALAHISLDVGVANNGYFFAGGAGPSLSAGNGSPEGVLARVVGSLYARLDGGANTTLYIKQTGTGNTGWAPVTP